MTVRVRIAHIRGAGRALLRALETVLLLAGSAFLLLFIGAKAEQYWGQYSAKLTLDRERVEMALPGAPSAKQMAAESGVVGRIKVPKMGIDVAIFEGSDGKTLRRGAGHLPLSAFPGEPGNVAISAHRDTFFRPLRHIEPGDRVEVQTLDGVYDYEVEWTRIVAPTDVEVVDPTPEPSLTLITCYPFYYVGNAPQRFIVRARQITQTAAASAP